MPADSANSDSLMIVQVALPVPLRQVFDYLPVEQGGPVRPGMRVLVPFGSRKLVGVVVAVRKDSAVPTDRLLPIAAVLDRDGPILDATLMKLLKWCWQYYKHAPGDVLQTALPPALRKPKGQLPAAPLQYRLTEEGEQRLELPVGRAVAQYAMLQALAQGPLADEHLCQQGERWRTILARLQEQGWVKPESLEASIAVGEPGPELTGEQSTAVADILAQAKGFSCHLLNGVTGSGKTEVYLTLLKEVLAKGRQGIVLVPEIGLTPQLIRRFQRRLGLVPVVLHSGLSAGERLSAWEAARSGRARLVIGTRSALFTPMPDLGLIVLDEEHDSSFKQQDGFRYSARDVAVKRAADLGIPVILGSATPSLESLSNAANGRYLHHRLRKRATKAALPSWRVLDMRQQVSINGLSKTAIDAIETTLQRGEQVMVFLNRRGYAPVLVCGQCGWNGQCQRCDANMTWHRSKQRLSCHHCGSEKAVPRFCPDCRADALVGLGDGTQQLESSLRERFPTSLIWRFDRDSTRAKGVFEDQVDQVRSGQPCIMVGTQMLAKGHHFPAVTLVVVVNIDQALYSADYRALERLGQTLLQVSGRAGRAEKPGEVVLQTYQPESEALQLLINEGYEAYSDWLLQDRRSAGLPPLSFQAQLRAEAGGRNDVLTFLQAAGDCFPPGKAQLMGPVPALMEKVAGRYRMFLLVQARSRPELHRQLDVWLASIPTLREARKVRWSVDVDPQDM